jgi:glycosyltransferase involved in cell wall biosynthesis
VRVLIADDVEPGWLSAQLTELGVPFARAALAPARRRYLRPARIPRYVAGLLRARGTVLREARALGADIVHVNTSALVVAAILFPRRGIRVLWHIHEIVKGRSPVALALRVAPLVAADRVVAVSEATLANLQPRARRARARVIHNGLPDEPVVPAALGLPTPVVAFVGRLNHWKGYGVFVDAATIVIADGARASFIVAGGPPPGDGWRVEDLRDRLERSGAGEGIRYLGERPDGAAILAAADIVVVPSTLPDPFPTVVLEAMRAARPVIASAHGGAPEMIVDGVTGLLVPPDDATALAAAVHRLLGDAPAREAMGRAARARFLTAFRRDRFGREVASLWDQE